MMEHQECVIMVAVQCASCCFLLEVLLMIVAAMHGDFC